MKTLIELFDECQTNNVIAAIALKPEKVVYIGFKETMTNERITYLENFFKNKGIDISLEFEIVGRFNLEAAEEKLLSVISRYPDSFVDITGGRELLLTAAGKASYGKNISIIQYDPDSGKLKSLENGKELSDTADPDITIKDIIGLNGGTVLPDAPWVLDADFCEDIKNVWELCRDNCGLWNRQATALGNFEKYGKLDAFFRVSTDLYDLRKRKKDAFINEELIEKLKEKNLIYGYEKNGDYVSFFYKNDSVRRLITKSGNALELYGYMTIKKIMAENEKFADDCDVGVFVDWDGKDIYGAETTNEIDIIIVKDFIPVFISCKNGEVYKEALYELDTMARRFGGEYAKKVMFASYVSADDNKKEYIKKRASDMGITLIYGIDKMPEEKFSEEIIKLI